MTQESKENVTLYRKSGGHKGKDIRHLNRKKIIKICKKQSYGVRQYKVFWWTRLIPSQTAKLNSLKHNLSSEVIELVVPHPRPCHLRRHRLRRLTVIVRHFGFRGYMSSLPTSRCRCINQPFGVCLQDPL